MHNVLMPQIIKTMQAGTVRRWLKAPGQNVAKGELLLEIETEDGLAQAESAVSGVVREILVPAGKTVKIQITLAVIAEGEAMPNITMTVPQASRLPLAHESPHLSKQAGETTAVRESCCCSNKKIELSGMTAARTIAPTSGPVIPVLMPQVGQSMEEGTILKWCVQLGETIKQGQIIFDVETDKATVEVEATDGGRLARIVVPEGATMAVKKPVAYLADSDADVDTYIATHLDESGAAKSVAAFGDEVSAVESAVVAGEWQARRLRYGSEPAVVEGGRVKASPAARKIAREHKIDLTTVSKGSGPGGRIVSSDVLTVQSGVGAAPSSVRDSKGFIRHRMSKMRRAIANSLLASKQNIPHFYERLTINADSLLAFYREQKPKIGCSLNDVITLACARVITEFSAFRSQLDKDELVVSPAVNIGIAVGIADGLVVPVLLGVERMTLAEVASNAKRIVASARAGKLEGVGHGNFTITNLGMFGVEEFAAIINPPEAAILAVGAARESVIVKDGVIRAGHVMTMTISCDHRIIDGVLAAKFLARLKEILESPQQLN
ncbi:MAG: 2-oxo acid dehydrogenase subunit E2 [Planctomycetota bacterium]